MTLTSLLNGLVGLFACLVRHDVDCIAQSLKSDFVIAANYLFTHYVVLFYCKPVKSVKLVRLCETVDSDIFRKLLKTHYFTSAFGVA